LDRKLLFLIGGGLAAVILLVVFLIVSKGNGETPTVTTSSRGSFIVWDYNDEKSAYDPVINSFQSTNGIKVEYIVKNPNTYYADTINAMAAGKGPDVWIIPNNMVAKYQDKLVAMPEGWIAEPKTMKSDIEVYQSWYPSVVSQDNIINNKIYGMPIAIDTLKLYANPILLSQILQEYRKANPDKDVTSLNRLFQQGPQTWDDLTEMVKIITQKNSGQIARSAIALGTANNVSQAPDILSLLMLQDGTKMISDDLATAQFHTQQNLFSNVNYPGTQALKFYASFADPKSPNYTWNSKMTDSIRAFANGEVAMMFDYNNALGQIQLINPQAPFITFNIPQIRETTHIIDYAKYDTLAVTKSAPDQELAWNFILMATDPTMVSGYRAVTKKNLVLSRFADQNAYNAVSWYDPDPDQVGPLLRNIIGQVNDGKDAQTAIDGAASQVTTLLQKLKQNNQ